MTNFTQSAGPQTQEQSPRQSPHPSSRPAINLHIEELVLRGFAARDRHRIGAAVEHELARLIGEQGMAALGTKPLALDRMNAGAIRVSAGAKPQAIGAQIAQSVFRSLRQQGRIAGGATGRPNAEGRQP